jgi:Zn ribbon nucleic-acid-binding protein
MKKSFLELQDRIDMWKENSCKDFGNFKFCGYCGESDTDTPCAEAYKRMASKNTNQRRRF